MPDYNPAVAAGIQAPDFASTLGRIANIQAEQARTGLYTLQSLQQQRQYNALMAGAAEMRSSGDANRASQAVLDAGGGPEVANQFLTFGANRNAINAAGGVTPTERNTLAGIPGTVAGSKKAVTEADAAVAKQYGPAVLVNPGDDEAYSQMVNAHFDTIPGSSAIERQAALAVKDPNQRREAAIRYGVAAQVPVEKLAETFRAGDTDFADYNNKNLTPAQRAGAAPILRQPGEVAQSKAQAEKQGGYFGNLYSGIAAAGNTAAGAKDEINIAKSVINDPGFYSGSGESVNLAYKRALASFGIDPGASLPQEAFRKVMAQNILNQVTGLREAQEQIGGAGSRIFQSQIQLMENAAQNPDNSIAANRFLTTLAERSADRSQKIADMAANYRGGKLDAGFEKQLRDYTNKNPLFSDAELAHPKLIGEDPKVLNYLRANKDNPDVVARFNAHYGKGASDAVLGQ